MPRGRKKGSKNRSPKGLVKLRMMQNGIVIQASNGQQLQLEFGEKRGRKPVVTAE